MVLSKLSRYYCYYPWDGTCKVLRHVINFESPASWFPSREIFTLPFLTNIIECEALVDYCAPLEYNSFIDSFIASSNASSQKTDAKLFRKS